MRIKDNLKKRKWKGQSLIQGQITLHGKSIQILMSQMKRISHVYDIVIFLAQKLYCDLVKPTAQILCFLVTSRKNDIVKFYFHFAKKLNGLKAVGYLSYNFASPLFLNSGYQ